MLRPGLILVPTAGRPVAVNGRDGRVTEVTVWVVVPKFVMTATCVSVTPTGTSAGPVSSGSSIDTTPACGISPSRVPSPLRGTCTSGEAAERVVNDSVPSALPAAAGRKVTTAVSLSPRDNVTGKVTGTGAWRPGSVSVTWPTRNSRAGAGVSEAPVVTVTPMTVTEPRAVTETCRAVLVPTLVGAKETASPAAAAFGAGRLNPSTRPSKVPM